MKRLMSPPADRSGIQMYSHEVTRRCTITVT